MNYNYAKESDLCYVFFLNNNDDYYEALHNTRSNDLFSLKNGYYLINNLEFLFVGILLLYASIVCINVYKLKCNFKLNNYGSFLNFFDIIGDFVNFSFLRKQNLIDQNYILSAIRFFGKKNYAF